MRINSISRKHCLILLIDEFYSVHPFNKSLSIKREKRKCDILSAVEDKLK